MRWGGSSEDPSTSKPIDSAGRLSQWFAERADSGSLVEYLKTFDVTLSVMQTEEGLRRIAREFVEDLVDDGVIYGEIRWAPEQHLVGGLSLDGAVEAVQAGLDDAVNAAATKGYDIQVGQLISAMRHNNRSMDIAQLALRHREKVRWVLILQAPKRVSLPVVLPKLSMSWLTICSPSLSTPVKPMV